MATKNKTLPEGTVVRVETIIIVKQIKGGKEVPKLTVFDENYYTRDENGSWIKGFQGNWWSRENLDDKNQELFADLKKNKKK